MVIARESRRALLTNSISFRYKARMKFDQLFLPDCTYTKAYSIQKEIHAAVLNNTKNNTLFFTTHEHVITCGVSSQTTDFHFPDDYYRSLGISVVKTDRGGKLTYHGPGQLVCYPIIRLDDYTMKVKDYIYSVEEIIIELLSHYEILGKRNALYPIGIWADDAKICSIGVHVEKRVTYHGLALNVFPDLSYFNLFTPCGIQNSRVTSMEKMLGRKFSLEEIRKKMTEIFIEKFS